MNQYLSSEIHSQQTHSMQLPQQQRPYPLLPKIARPASVLLEPSMAYQAQQDKNITTRPRSQSHTSDSSYVPPPAASTSLPSLTSATNNITAHEPLSDNPVRFQNWRQPAHRSKLSMQYTPSEEDSDEESGKKSEAKRRSKYMSGTALELNSNGESLRALSQLSISDTLPRSAIPSISESTDSDSVKSDKKKLSLGKRISRFFGGGSSKSSDATSSSISSRSSSSSSINESAVTSSTSLPPIDELAPPSRTHNGLYTHQRSHSTPDQIGKITQSGKNPVNSKMEERTRKARDSGFQEAGGKGHRRYSSSTTVMPRASGPHSSSPKLHPHSTSNNVNGSGNRSSIYKSEAMHIDQQQQSRRSTQDAPLSTSSPQLRNFSERELQRPPLRDQNHRHSFITAEMTNYASTSTLSPLTPTTPRRSSTPIPASETLISKVDREKASVCFQSPNPKKETYTKDANLDPILSNLVLQHRKDFKTNQRLGGTPQPSAQQQQQQYSPHTLQGSPRARTPSYLDEQQIRDPNMRRDSNGSQHYYHINGSNTASPQLIPVMYPSSPGLYASDTQMKRLSTGSQHQLPQQQHPYLSNGHRASFSGSQGSLHQFQSHSQSHSQHQQQGQHSPSVGPQRTSPKRQSSAGYFTHPQQQQYQFDPPQTPPQPLHTSPLPSPSFGAVQTHRQLTPEISLQQQHQQQMQLEHLQQIRVQQQKLLLQQQQQQQQLQHQLHQTRVAVQQQQQIGLGLGVLPMQMQTMSMPTSIAMAPQTIGMGMNMGVQPLVLTPYMQQPQPQQQAAMGAIYSYPSNATVTTAGYQ
ncbi:hypothetical protein BGX27_003278 [Mortierella sp. AM989]|nr:hypothetical protein BGX27_003278 [Mortierella sp. AM989]